MDLKDFTPITIRPAANGFIVEPERDANCAYDTSSLHVFGSTEDLLNYIVKLAKDDYKGE